MIRLALIGGSGLTRLEGLSVDRHEAMSTPYGDPSTALTHGRYAGRDILFLPRHGHPHAIPPHRVNYRANIQALKEAGAGRILAVNAVGGITADMAPPRLVIPDQIIDYTWGRQHSFFEDGQDAITHIDFTRPYAGPLRDTILKATLTAGIAVIDGATYGATQGPRLETAAEIRRLQQDGCDIVGMTGMPEAALAREMEMDYASICVVVNWAAGKSDETITMDAIRANLDNGMADALRLIEETIKKL